MLNFSAEWSLTDVSLHLWAATTSIMYVKSFYVASKKTNKQKNHFTCDQARIKSMISRGDFLPCPLYFIFHQIF